MAREIRILGTLQKGNGKDCYQDRRRTDGKRDTCCLHKHEQEGLDNKDYVTPTSRVSSTPHYINPLLPPQTTAADADAKVEEHVAGPSSTPQKPKETEPSKTPPNIQESTNEIASTRLELKVVLEKNALQERLEEALRAIPSDKNEQQRPNREANLGTSSTSSTQSTSTEQTDTSTRSTRSSTTEPEGFLSPRRSRRLEASAATAENDDVFKEEEGIDTPRRSKRLQNLRDSEDEEGGKQTQTGGKAEDQAAADSSSNEGVEAKPKRNRRGKADDTNFPDANANVNPSASAEDNANKKDGGNDGTRAKRRSSIAERRIDATLELGNQVQQLRHELRQQGVAQAHQGSILEELLRRSEVSIDREPIHRQEAQDLVGAMKIEVGGFDGTDGTEGTSSSSSNLEAVEFAPRDDEGVEASNPPNKREEARGLESDDEEEEDAGEADGKEEPEDW